MNQRGEINTGSEVSSIQLNSVGGDVFHSSQLLTGYVCQHKAERFAFAIIESDGGHVVERIWTGNEVSSVQIIFVDGISDSHLASIVDVWRQNGVHFQTSDVQQAVSAADTVVNATTQGHKVGTFAIRIATVAVEIFVLILSRTN